jgi:hypothetical protein
MEEFSKAELLLALVALAFAETSAKAGNNLVLSVQYEHKKSLRVKAFFIINAFAEP